MQALRVRVPASTSNLGPAFDCLGLALDLPLRLRAVPGGRGVHASYHGEGATLLSRRHGSLLLEAMRAFATQFRAPLPRAFRVEADNAIPLARGLGSSGAAIAAGLTLASELTGRRVPPSALVDLGARIEGHPENVAASLLGGLVIVCREGSGWRVRREGTPPGFLANVFVPDHMTRTATARKAVPRRPALDIVTHNLGATALLVRALLRGSAEDLMPGTQDALHQERRLRHLPALARLIRDLRAAGIPAALSGAGPSVLALLPAGSPAERRFDLLARRCGMSGRLLRIPASASGARVLA